MPRNFSRTFKMCKEGGFQKAQWIVSFLLLVIFLSSQGQAFELANCRVPLGMQSGAIPDSAVTASSSFEEESVGAKFARIRTDQKGGAWCPLHQISADVYEFLQIDLQSLHVISLVETQGRFGNGQGQEYMEKYLLEYKREEDGPWMRFRDRKGHEIFQGNTNTYIAELREVNPPIIARKIRFVPYSDNVRTVCMRVELYGCPWKEGVVSYNVAQGERRGMEVDLYDFTYDGKTENNYLSNGMGQLFDGEEGQSNFRLDPQELGMKGYEWVGWKNDTTSTTPGPVEFLFRFDAVRNFTSVQLHCNNMFSKEVRVFKSAVIHFSVGGKYYNQEPVRFEYMRDTLMEYARPVIIKLNNRIGKYVKMQLFFDAKWLMISEISFSSEIVKVNVSEEVGPMSITLPTTTVAGHKGSDSTPYAGDKDGGKGSEGGASDDHTLGGTTETPTVHRPTNTIDDQFIGSICGALGALLLLILIVVAIIICHTRRQKQRNAQRQLKPCNNGQVAVNLNDLRQPFGNGKVMNGIVYNCVPPCDADSDPEKSKTDIYNEPKDCIQNRKLPDIPRNNVEYSSDCTNTSREYAVPDLSRPLIVALPPEKENNLSAEDDNNFYATADLTDIMNIQGVSGNNVYAAPNPDFLYREDVTVMELPRENLKFIEKLGEGQFGEVHLCECMHLNELLGDDYHSNRTTSKSLLVAVKVLRKTADETARNDFRKEINLMSRLKDPNIVHVLGVCTNDEPMCMIVEYMKYGDLNQFLAEHVAESTLARQTHAKTISYGGLVYMAAQVASGMKYLESLNMVHRDLATRNCLVGNYYTIKIADFGMSRSLYSADYYRIEGRAVLPIRWMAWESILLGKFTTKSDVWSFGVTLWEILTFAKEQPFEMYTDEQVIENCGHFYRNDGKIQYLPQPTCCPREIYDLMKECWNRVETERPAFKEIHMFLQRKSMGYDPKEEKMMQNKLPVC
ncbi:discoidin domain-containing receptor 2 isoform X1 [Lingula anatina]|uniref:Discoidin domain-containing receptor 2 isoform X1 n=1 Tax=Lingula anatina TaxID=7574 RepID=A0A1S3H8M2_LINAN|nr:discoidin domain-containing receptor 2 isoform X1 [Lingula anatina]XP_013381473.1 discoidin domain-containing receptor 2 isoform X1 [Lingula anatina]XP_013381474.1 discoidin domain-containing receptor 2 isoform X1 [Lingula anatina]XP_013381475.1 discoidin domain-containing receptor 2 isoform X1 [Lingula anatina]XP_013381476.1 discoidin domain-containing receptor 2 isoform X1 [Lingula anatina]XP_013381477.1 discoidin domain-containing receptor 2 isoform X1 [Lingula anatina]XP_013381478.1 di|eukprot:XP_013381472.1 discoidin domain-containing receptor 2 isoform X1 [Lingula anatina]